MLLKLFSNDGPRTIDVYKNAELIDTLDESDVKQLIDQLTEWFLSNGTSPLSKNPIPKLAL